MKTIAAAGFAGLVLTAAVAAAALTTSADAVAPFGADAFEAYDTTATARVLGPETARTFHTADDRDLALVVVSRAGAPIYAETFPAAGDALDTRLRLSLLRADGTLQEVDADEDTEQWPDTLASAIIHRASVPGTYVVEAAPAVSGAVGAYRLAVGIGARRIAGADRYATAAAVSRTAYRDTGLQSWGTSQGPAAVVIASGEDFPDALAASVLAAELEGPLLLTRSGALPATTETEIARLGAARLAAGLRMKVYVVGGAGAVADPVLTRVRALPVVGSVVRLAGPDRASTAARVALESRSVAGAPDTAFLVAGRSWADAVAAAPVAAALSSPILLAGDAALPTATRTELLDLGIKRVVIVGGTGVVPTGIEDAVRAVPGVTAVVRIAGSDRFETAERVAAWGVGNAGLDPRTTIVAGGADFPDALAAAPLTRWTEGPLVLTRAGSVPAPVAAFLDGRGADRRLDLVVGGPAAVSEATLASLANRY